MSSRDSLHASFNARESFHDHTVRIIASDPLGDSTTNLSAHFDRLPPPDLDESYDEQVPLVSASEEKSQWKKKKWLVLALITCFAFLSPLTNSTYTPGLKTIQDDFHTTKTLVLWTSASYSLGMAVMPLVWGPLSDRLSRKYVIFAALLLYSGGSLWSAFSWSIWWLIAGRGLQAAGLASLITVGSASISDVFAFSELGRAMGIFGAAPGIMPVVSPMFGGFLFDQFGFKILFGGLCGLGLLASVVVFFLLPETLDKNSTVKRSFNFIAPLRLLLTPSIGLTVLSTSLNYGGSSLMLNEFSFKAKEIHPDMKSWKIGLYLAPYGVGTILGNLVSGKLSDFNRRRFGAKGHLLLVIIGLLGYPATLFVFGRFVEHNFYVASACTFFVGFFITFTYPPSLCFAMEKAPKNPSAVAAAFQVSYLPSTMTCLMVGGHLFEMYGVDWVFLVVAGIVVVLSLPILCMFIYHVVADKKKPPVPSIQQVTETPKKVVSTSAGSFSNNKGNSESFRRV